MKLLWFTVGNFGVFGKSGGPAAVSWGPWVTRGSCPVTCGGGQVEQTRICSGGSTFNPCTKDDTSSDGITGLQTIACNETPCPRLENDTPCPSAECWDYDADAKACNLKEGVCSEHTCGATQIDISFSSLLFGELNDVGFSIEPQSNNQAELLNAKQFKFDLTCPLGGCGMTYDLDDQNRLVFTIKLQQEGNVRKRTMVDNKKIELNNGLVLETTPWGVGVNFICRYSTTISLSTIDFKVEKVNFDGHHAEEGDLTGGFTLTVGPDGGPFKLGDRATVTATWSVTTLSTISFHFNKCTVTHGTNSIDVVRDDCYSETVGAKYESAEKTSTKEVFSYKTFRIADQDDTNQSMTCKLKLCIAGKPCPKAVIVQMCPGGTEFSLYKYTLLGLQG